jgi:F420-dependent oxidoreductase-like protein
MKEYLSILRPLLNGEQVGFQGETVTFNGALQIEGVAAPPILVAALGTQMLNVCGRMADGTITWMTGPATLAEHIVPTLRSAATEAGRPEATRVVAGLPVCVTDDPDGARERASNVFAIYGHLPSYRAMLDREGAAGPADVAIVGSEQDVRDGISRVAESGATDLAAVEFGVDEGEQQRTRELLRSLL